MSKRRTDVITVSSLSKEELEELYAKYGRPGEIAPGIPGQRRRTFPRPNPAPTAPPVEEKQA
ncbi:MAG TPA: hypothetical protein VFF14_04820 [Candidatus Deferrimicrobium sp.]|nr:hypothetical protein [Candidatus Deferrimicrobium sp.]